QCVRRGPCFYNTFPAGAPPGPSPPRRAAETGVPDDGVDPGGCRALESRDFPARRIGDDHRGTTGIRRFQVIADDHPVRLVRCLDVSLAEEIVVRPERPGDPLDRWRR